MPETLQERVRFRIWMWWHDYVVDFVHDHEEGGEHENCSGCQQRRLVNNYKDMLRASRRK